MIPLCSVADCVPSFSAAACMPGDIGDSGTFQLSFGSFILLLGVLACMSNCFILIVVVRHFLTHSNLFLIILNLAFIDLLKALCAVYMGSVLISPMMYRHTDASDYLMAFKMLQISTLIMNTSNVASVLNLVVAALNELLCIKLPFKYHRIITRNRVLIAILITWLLSVSFGLGKYVHGKLLHTGGGVLIDVNFTVANSFTSNCTDMPLITRDPRRSLHRSVADRDSVNVYTVALVCCLLSCLLLVIGIYLNLYMEIRRSRSIRSNMSSRHIRRRNALKQSKLQTDSNTDSPACTMADEPCQPAIANEFDLSVNSSLPSRPTETTSNLISLRPRRSNFSISAAHKRCVRVMKRYKTVVMLLSICLLYATYLSVYLSLQILHLTSVRTGLSAAKLAFNYKINLILRAVFVLHTCINPFLFLRIKSFRHGLAKLFRIHWQKRKFSTKVELEPSEDQHSCLV